MSDTTDEFTAAERAALRQMLDRAAITDTLNTYWHALDSRAFDLLDDVFAEEVDFAPGLPALPRDEVKKMMEGVSAYPTSHHGPRTMRITIDGDRAHANSYAMDFLVLDPPNRQAAPAGTWPVHDNRPGPALRFHGLRYVDELVRRPEGWRITRRRGPIALWRAELAGISLHPDYENLRSAQWPDSSVMENGK